MAYSLQYSGTLQYVHDRDKYPHLLDELHPPLTSSSNGILLFFKGWNAILCMQCASSCIFSASEIALALLL
jgi:hypothetical protein